MRKSKYNHKDLPFEIIVVDDKPKKNIKSIIIRLLLVICALFLLGWIISFYISYYSRPSDIRVQYKREEMEELTPYAKIPPYPAYNGEIIIYPDYECVCPFEVSTETGIGDYYVRLHYLSAPYSEEVRRLNYSASAPYEADIAFYISSGKTVIVDVPVGTYEFYYATGQTFYGSKKLFGINTQYFPSKEKLDFYVKDNTYQGITIKLKKVPYGNFSTRSVNKNSFPTD